MTLTEARNKIRKYTADGCTAYICVNIVYQLYRDQFMIDQSGYTISDWKDSSSVEEWTNGKFSDKLK